MPSRAPSPIVLARAIHAPRSAARPVARQETDLRRASSRAGGPGRERHPLVGLARWGNYPDPAAREASSAGGGRPWGRQVGRGSTHIDLIPWISSRVVIPSLTFRRPSPSRLGVPDDLRTLR